MKRLLVIIFVTTLLYGCSNSTFDKAMEQGKLALAGKEFDKALSSFQLALEEEPKDKEAKALYQQLVAYNQVKEATEDKSWDDALTKANKLLEEDDLKDVLRKELEQYITIAEMHKEQDKTVSEAVEKIKSLVTEKNYSEASKLIEELKQNESLKEVLISFSSQIDELANIVNGEMQKQKQAEELAAQKRAVEAASAKNSRWKGNYLAMLSGNHNFSELTIKNLKGNEFDFAIKNTSNYWVDDENGGGWNGLDEQNIEGQATITNETALYEKDTCDIIFQYTDEGVDITKVNCEAIDSWGNDLYRKKD